MKWRVRVRIRVDIPRAWVGQLIDRPPEGATSLHRKYYADKDHPLHMNPYYAQDIYDRFIIEDFEEFERRIEERGVEVKWQSHTVERG